MSRRWLVLLLVAGLSFGAGCSLFNGDGSDEEAGATTPTAPTSTTTSTTQTGSLDAFGGEWVSTGGTAGATSCAGLQFRVTPTTATAATIAFAATCAGNLAVSGSGSGTLSGSTLNWTSQGTVSQGGVTCPFSFTNSTATVQTGGGLQVTYSGTVCGIAVSGTSTLQHPAS